jgi:ferric-dicitrate binding protein FerR (iron transport regulator)
VNYSIGVLLLKAVKMLNAGGNNKVWKEYSEEEISQLLNKLQVKTFKSKNEAWSDFIKKISEKEKIEKTRSLIYLKLAAAASIALIIAFSFWKIYINKVEIYCKPGTTISYNLPDKSNIKLNAGSSVKFNKRKWSSNRVIYLDGEAFFKVKKGKSFKVITKKGTIAVLGTTFNVSARGDKLEVYCETGKVSVLSTDTVLLTAGMKSLQTKTNQKTKVEKATTHDATWRIGEFWFNNAPLEEVLNEIERQFNVSIEYQITEQRYYSGYFNKKSLAEALTNVLDPMGLQYRINNNKISILK